MHRALLPTFAATLLAVTVAGQNGKMTVVSCPRDEGWFARSQADDGSFVGADGKPDVEATALVVLALLGDGSTPREGPHRQRVRLAWQWLRKRQQNTGAYADDVRAHGIATYATVEAIGLGGFTGKVADTLRGEAQRAVDELMRRRGLHGGFGADDTPDAATTSWCLCALQSARHFGYERIPDHRELLRWFDEHPSRTPLAAACELHQRLLADQAPEDDPACARTMALAKQVDPADAESCFWSTYAWFRHGGEPWRQWHEQLKAPLHRTQNTDGEHRGSWDPPKGIGRAKVTALRVLTLEAYYRYSRLIR